MTPVGLPLPPLPADIVALPATALALLGAVVWIDRRGRLHAGALYLGDTIDEALVRACEMAPREMWGQG